MKAVNYKKYKYIYLYIITEIQKNFKCSKLLDFYQKEFMEVLKTFITVLRIYIIYNIFCIINLNKA